MDRKEYLDWCRDCSILPRGVHGVRQMVPDNRKVVLDGGLYYPQGYLLEFSETGSVIHTAILHDLKANSVVSCPLDKVAKYVEEVL